MSQDASAEREIEIATAADSAEADALLRQLADAGVTGRAQAKTSGLLRRLTGARPGITILVPATDRRRASQALRQRRM